MTSIYAYYTVHAGLFQMFLCEEPAKWLFITAAVVTVKAGPGFHPRNSYQGALGCDGASLGGLALMLK